MFAHVFRSRQILSLALLLLTLAGCDNYGTKKSMTGVDIYYKSPITTAEVDQLGAFLASSGFASSGDAQKSVQLLKDGAIYQFRMVVKKGIDTDPKYIAMLQPFDDELSAGAFNGAPVALYLCDDHFNTLRMVSNDGTTEKPATSSYGDLAVFKGTEVYHQSPVTDSQAQALGEYLVSSGFADGNRKTIQVLKEDGTYQFRMVVGNVNLDESTLQAMITYRKDLSDNVFGGEPLEIHVCTDQLKTVRVIDQNTDI